MVSNAKTHKTKYMAIHYAKTLPTFIIVGGARCGTTSLHQWLDSHPEVFMSRVKETNYFAHLTTELKGPGDEALLKPLKRTSDGKIMARHAAIVQSLDQYSALFYGSEGHPAKGEASPSYLYYSETAMRIRECIPACKIIIVLRDPVERAFSHYRFFVKQGREALPFEDTLRLENERQKNGWEWAWAFRGVGLYASKVAEYLRVFPNRRVGIWLYEDLRESPQKIFNEICRFIGVSTCLNVVFKRANDSGIGGINDALSPPLRKVFRKIIPEKTVPFFQSIDRRFFQKKVSMRTETRRLLVNFYQKDILTLHDLKPELNVIRWLDAQERKIKHG